MGRRHWLERLAAGATAWNGWRDENPRELVSLRRHWLDERNFRGLDFAECDFSYSVLRGSDLRDANLSEANLTGVDLSNCDLRYANLAATLLDGSDCHGVVLNRTLLLDLNLEALCVDGVVHEGPSFVDLRSIVRSIHVTKLPEFLAYTGMPQALARRTVALARSLSRQDVRNAMRSIFLSYGRPDEAFARSLNLALRDSGVTTYFFPESAVPGERLHKVMRSGVNAYDKVIVVCSKASLQRAGVLNEIAETLSREAREGGTERLIPVCLDNYLFEPWGGDRDLLRTSLVDRVVADFRAAPVGSEQFGAAFQKLLRALDES